MNLRAASTHHRDSESLWPPRLFLGPVAPPTHSPPASPAALLLPGPLPPPWPPPPHLEKDSSPTCPSPSL